jgi:hypothetical protein
MLADPLLAERSFHYALICRVNQYKLMFQLSSERVRINV